MVIGRLIRWLAACSAILSLGPAHAFIVTFPIKIHEYQNDLTGHYVLLTDADALLVDRGAAGPGWGRTGYYFETYNFAAGGDTRDVCRFYSPLNNSHFFTASPLECAVLRQPDSGWIFEKFAFTIQIPIQYALQCANGLTPVYRVYNNRHEQHDANHRYTADATVRDAMLAAGWKNEGIAFCATGGGIAPETHLSLFATTTGDPIAQTHECEVRLGGCVGLTQIAPMPTRIPPYVPPSYITLNPVYPWGQVETITGVSGADMWTSLPAGSPLLVQRSFVQIGGPIGIHLQGSERMSGVYASINPMQVLPGGSSPDRVFPWRGTRNRTLVLSTQISVRRALRSNDSAHAYGHPMLEFVDQVSGRKFYVTLQAFGTLPASDFVGPDVTTGWAIVSTSFRTNPLFGKRIAGEYVQCDPASIRTCMGALTLFKFAIDRPAFQAVLDRARVVDPALSASVADFFLASFRLHNETYLDAELGMSMFGMTLEVFVAGAPGSQSASTGQ